MIDGTHHRHASEATPTGGGACALVVIRGDNGEVQLLFHASPETGAVLTPELALEVADALVKAAQDR